MLDDYALPKKGEQLRIMLYLFVMYLQIVFSLWFSLFSFPSLSYEQALSYISTVPCSIVTSFCLLYTTERLLDGEKLKLYMKAFSLHLLVFSFFKSSFERFYHIIDNVYSSKNFIHCVTFLLFSVFLFLYYYSSRDEM